MEKVSGSIVEKRTAEITRDWKIENSGKNISDIIFDLFLNKCLFSYD